MDTDRHYPRSNQYLLTAAAVIMVLAGAYYFVGRAARRSMEIKQNVKTKSACSTHWM
jgi:hypothetical protein